MIRVTIDLLPGGDEGRKRTLHVIEIWNDLVGTLRNQKRGNYGYRIGKSNRRGWAKQGRIEGFPRMSLNAVRLLQRVLNDAYPQDRTK